MRLRPTFRIVWGYEIHFLLEREGRIDRGKLERFWGGTQESSSRVSQSLVKSKQLVSNQALPQRALSTIKNVMPNPPLSTNKGNSSFWHNWTYETDHAGQSNTSYLILIYFALFNIYGLVTRKSMFYSLSWQTFLAVIWKVITKHRN